MGREHWWMLSFTGSSHMCTNVLGPSLWCYSTESFTLLLL